MKNFCYWRIKQNKYSENYICTGRTFAGHIGNCPFKNETEALLKCPEILWRRKGGHYEKPKVYAFSGPPYCTLIPSSSSHPNRTVVLAPANRPLVFSRRSDLPDRFNDVSIKKEEVKYETE